MQGIQNTRKRDGRGASTRAETPPPLSPPPPTPQTLDEVCDRILELQRELAELQELRSRLLKHNGLVR